MTATGRQEALTGRLRAVPAALLHAEVLEPQFRFEVAHLLDHYLALERILLVEYRRMGLLSADQVSSIAVQLDEIDADTLRADPTANLSDIAMAIERHVTADIPVWHVDRSRNDFQAAAQLMFGKKRLLAAADGVLSLADTAIEAALSTVELPMPGYTHLQAAQVISPGFYLAAVSGQALFAVRRLLAVHDDIDLCPLGAGAMSGQQLPWDRDRMARLAGFAGPQPHALTAVASRSWLLLTAAELSQFAVLVSRFTTDLMSWASESYGFLELPDELAGISAAMPQKKNYPVLERIRGRSAQVTGLAHTMLLANRNTAYSNSVEVSKEAGRGALELFESFESMARLLTAVLAAAQFRADRMRTACAQAFMGGMALANELTLEHQLPWRTAQVVAGEYITAAMSADRLTAALLTERAARYGYHVPDAESVVHRAFDVDLSLRRNASDGSAHPDSVRALLTAQRAELDRHTAEVAARRQRTAAGAAELTGQLAR